MPFAEPAVVHPGLAGQSAQDAGVLAPAAPAPPKRKRLHELDSLRGIAACTVVFCHFYNLHEADRQSMLVQVLFRGVFRFLVAGHEAVLLFFVLSGFVLTLPFLKKQEPRYVPFLVKRVCRIYLPYLGALLLAVTGDFLFRNTIPQLGPWFQAIWSQPLTWSLVLQHVGLIGRYDQMQLNGAFWSLIIEMRVSILFPLLMLLLRPVRTAKQMRLVGAGAVLCGLISPSAFPDLPPEVFSTIHYMMVFVVGSLLARSIKPCSEIYLRQSRFVRGAFCFGILLVWSFIGILSAQPALYGVYDMGLTLAAAGSVIVALTEPRVRQVLLHSAVVYVGEISYSIYLLHVTILLSLVHALYGKVPLAVVLPVYLLLTFGLSALFYQWVEVPSMRLGTQLTKRRQAS